MVHYFNCCYDYEKKFYDLIKHDFKNNQHSVLMALDLFKLKEEEKYLDMISEITYKSLNFVDRLKEFEPSLFNGEDIDFHSCLETIQNASIEHKAVVSGDDCFVFADSSFSSVFKLLLNTLTITDSAEISFQITSFSEDGFLKCRIDVTVPVSVPPESAALLVNPEPIVTGDIASLSIYAARHIINKYSGRIFLKESSSHHSVFSIILYQESDEFKALLLK